MKLVNEQKVYTSFAAAALDIQTMVKNGWKVDENEYPTTVGFNFEVNYHRYVDTNEPGKPTRAEILEKARAAKADKRQQETVNG